MYETGFVGKISFF